MLRACISCGNCLLPAPFLYPHSLSLSSTEGRPVSFSVTSSESPLPCFSAFLVSGLCFLLSPKSLLLKKHPNLTWFCVFLPLPVVCFCLPLFTLPFHKSCRWACANPYSQALSPRACCDVGRQLYIDPQEFLAAASAVDSATSAVPFTTKTVSHQCCIQPVHHREFLIGLLLIWLSHLFNYLGNLYVTYPDLLKVAHNCNIFLKKTKTVKQINKTNHAIK